MKLRIKQRQFSSNVIEASTKKENGKDKWFVYLIPALKKEEGDPLCDKLLNFLHSKELPCTIYYHGKEDKIMKTITKK